MSKPKPLTPEEAMRHLDPDGRLAGFSLSDPANVALRLAVDLWGEKQQPPVAGAEAVRAIVEDHLILCGLWPAPHWAS